MDSNEAILLSCAILFMLYFNSLSVHALELSVYQTAQFTNPVTSSEFTRFTRHNETGTIYIGASDALYQLGPDFVKTQMVDTRVDECQGNVVSCPNYNKILVIDYINNTIITCGSENYMKTDERGTCNIRGVNDISTIVRMDNNQVVPPDLLTTEAIIRPGPDGWFLYVGVTYHERNIETSFIITRRLPSGLVNDILNANGFTTIVTTNANYASLTINFVHSFLYDGYTYFVTHQREEDAPEFISKISRVCHGDGSVKLWSFTEITLECQGHNGNIYNLIQAAHLGPAGLDLGASFGINHEVNVLYGVFAKNEEGTPSVPTPNVPSMQSALCIYKMDDIEAAMFEAVAGCFGRNPNGSEALENSVDYRANYLDGSGTACEGFSEITDEQVSGQLCSPKNWRYAKGIVPLVSTAVIEWTDITPSSIITTTHWNHTIAFVGTMQGDMVKVHIEDKESAREYERFPVGSAVLRDAEFEENQDQLTILTKKQIIKLNVSKCDEYATCDECIGSNGGQDGDPYCGWCTLERRCSRYDSCPMADVSSRWLPYNSAQCVDISMVAPYDSLPITLTEQQITLTVEQLPDLIDSSAYQCTFDGIPAVPATKTGNQLMCTTPAASDIPRIPDGKDHVTMQLYVHSTETQVKFVQRDFYFYECNNHKGCVSCTNSSWACDWCIYSNKCTHDNGTCSNEDDLSSVIIGQNNPEMKQRHGSAECPQLMAQDGEILIPVGVSSDIRVNGTNLPDANRVCIDQGPYECPQLIAQDREILIPVGVSSDIRVNGTNLPASNRVSGYSCILNIEGNDVTTVADRSGDEFTCQLNMYMYNGDVQELNVSLSIAWNTNNKLDDIHGFTVILYTCEVQRPDCSRCLSNSTARQELMCGWCTADDMCTVSDSSQCSGDWFTPTGNQNCPAPVLSSVWPPSGPHEGNTTISVIGTDLGTQFTDIIKITVGGQNCSTDDLSQEYLTGQSVSCRTMSGDVDSEETISVFIQGKDGNVQESTGNVVFTYRDPSITSFEPIEGPEAGGTMVTIRGQYLDACSHVSASIGPAECRINRMNDVIDATTAECYTTDAPIGTSERLQVFFDGAMRQSADMFIYRPNPTVTNVHPLNTIQSGGISLTISGSGFDLAQGAQMILYEQAGPFQENCDVQNDTMMVCRTPDTRPGPAGTTRRRRQTDPSSEASFGFIIADVTDLLMWSEKNNVTLANFPDPVYSTYPDPMPFSNIINIKGENLNAGSTQDDVTVYIGEERAAINSLGASVLTITIPDQNPGPECVNGNTTDNPCIFVIHGNLEFYIGTVIYPIVGVSTSIIIIGIAVVCGILIVTLLLLSFLYRQKVKGHQVDRDELLMEMETMKSNIADEIRDGWVKLQTDVTDLTKDLAGSGMPFVTHRQYAISMFFAGLDTRPLTNEPDDIDDDTESALLELSKLLGNKSFLTALIQTIDEDKNAPNKDRLTIASMLTVLMILEDKLPYLTDVMITIMTAQVQDAIDDDKPTKLFQRTELIMEKLMSNWIALSLYDFLKDHAAHPLFMLYRAIKCQTEKGPIDMVTNKSYISLNDDNIISERLTYEELTLDITVNDDSEKQEVTVLDVDTIGQVKGKILDAIHRNKAYSSRVQTWEVDLEWRQGTSGHLILQDIDVSSTSDPGWKRINTLKHFSVPSGSRVTLTHKQDMPNSTVGKKLSRYSNILSDTAYHITFSANDPTQAEDGIMLWHLVKDEDEPVDSRQQKKHQKRTLRQRKQIREILFPRLLGTKGALQDYMDSMFAAILNKDDVPVGIKYIFDIFDGLAVRYDIKDDAVLHKWKSNILPLRFWQKIITNPKYIFDINQTPSEESCLAVISQAFYDAFRKNPEKISEAASYKKLLYNKEIPKYHDMVENYYKNVSDMQRISKSTLDRDLKDICEKFAGLFSRVSTLTELHKLVCKYKDKLIEALDEDEVFEQSGLSDQLERVLGLLPTRKTRLSRLSGNVYQQDVSEEE